MKKIKILLALLASTLFLSSCFIVDTPYEPNEPLAKTYSVGIKNNSDFTITDWYVYRSFDGTKYLSYDYDMYTVKPGQKRTLTGIPSGYYYCVKYKVQGSYNTSESFYLDDNMLLTVSNKYGAAISILPKNEAGDEKSAPAVEK